MTRKIKSRSFFLNPGFSFKTTFTVLYFSCNQRFSFLDQFVQPILCHNKLVQETKSSCLVLILAKAEKTVRKIGFWIYYLIDADFTRGPESNVIYPFSCYTRVYIEKSSLRLSLYDRSYLINPLTDLPPIMVGKRCGLKNSNMVGRLKEGRFTF